MLKQKGQKFGAQSLDITWMKNNRLSIGGEDTNYDWRSAEGQFQLNGDAGF